MDKILKKISELIDPDTSYRLESPLEQIRRLPRGNQILKRIASSPDRFQLEDYLAEVRYALVFLGMGFYVEIEPFGGKGPDMRISRDNHRAVVEVTRFRKIHSGLPQQDLSNEHEILEVFVQYGDPARDIRKAFDKIGKKFHQVGNEEAIIAVWNDDKELEHIEVELAVNDIRSDIKKGVRSLPDGLQFVLYSSSWSRVGDNRQQLYCFPLRKVNMQHQIRWQQELDSSTVSELVQRALNQPLDAE